MSSFTVRKARHDDCASILELIRELAVYEKMEDQVKMTVDVLQKDGFGDEKYFHSFVAEKEVEGKVKLVGFVLFYYIYSTWLGKCIYMEDLYVSPEYRGQGIGSQLMGAVCKTAVDTGCERVQFAVLDWNTPSIEYYKRQGAVNLTQTEGWHIFRFTGEDIQKMASKYQQ